MNLFTAVRPEYSGDRCYSLIPDPKEPMHTRKACGQPALVTLDNGSPSKYCEKHGAQILADIAQRGITIPGRFEMSQDLHAGLIEFFALWIQKKFPPQQPTAEKP